MGMSHHDEAVIRWKARIEQQMASGMTQRDWCKENRVNESCFSSWKVRIQGDVFKVEAEAPLWKDDAEQARLCGIR